MVVSCARLARDLFTGGNVRAQKIFLAPLMAGALVLAACGGGQNQETGGEEPAGEASAPPVTSQDINEKDRADLAQGGTMRLTVAEFCSGWNVSTVDCNNDDLAQDRKSTRLNSSHANISYAVF